MDHMWSMGLYKRVVAREYQRGGVKQSESI